MSRTSYAGNDHDHTEDNSRKIASQYVTQSTSIAFIFGPVIDRFLLCSNSVQSLVQIIVISVPHKKYGGAWGFLFVWEVLCVCLVWFSLFSLKYLMLLQACSLWKTEGEDRG